MPPRHAYWTILVDDQPTAFRAHEADELIPTLNRLKEKHSSAVMKWFERGKLWDSKDAARAEGLGRGERRWQGPRPDRPDESPPRDRNWRPGGEHRDPRQKYKDAKKAKWNRFKKNIRDRVERTPGPAASSADPRKFSPPHGDPLRSKTRRDWQPSDRGGAKPNDRGGWKPGDRDRWNNRDRSSSSRPPQAQRDRQREDWRDDRRGPGRPPPRERPQGFQSDRPRDERPVGDRPRDRRESRPKWNKPGEQKKRFGGKKPWGGEPAGRSGPKSDGQRPRFRSPGRPDGRRNPRGPRGPRKPRDDE